MTLPRLAGLAAVLVLALAGCKDELKIPDPVKLTRAAIGNYCNMIIVDHPGPKVQIHEKGYPKPLWFSSVRDGLAYLKLPGEAQKVLAVYVHDMGRAVSWEAPQDQGIWIDANTAVYVIGSSKRGGMGAREAVPFAERAKAERFMAQFGGRLVRLSEIPQDYLIGDAETASPTAHAAEQHQHGG